MCIRDRVKAVDRGSMTLTEGEIRGLVGESGSGKSLIAKAICGVNKDNWRVPTAIFGSFKRNDTNI